MRHLVSFVLCTAFLFGNSYAADQLDAELTQRLSRDKKTYQAGLNITEVYTPELELKYWTNFLEAQPTHIYAPNIKKRVAQLQTQVTIPTKTTPTPVASSPTKLEKPLEGLMLGAGVSEVLGNTGVGGGVRYWWEYLGVTFGLGFETGSLDVNGNNVIDGTGFQVGWGFLAGFPYGRIKPHFNLGFGYGYSKDSIQNISVKTFELSPTIGVDFLAADHLVFGLDVLSFPFVLWGEATSGNSSTGVGGNDITFLSAFRVSYMF